MKSTEGCVDPLIMRLQRHYHNLAPHVKERATSKLLHEAIRRISVLEDGVVMRLRGQLQNCVNHLEGAKRHSRGTERDAYDAAIASANKALYESEE